MELVLDSKTNLLPLLHPIREEVKKEGKNLDFEEEEEEEVGELRRWRRELLPGQAVVSN